jgi:hypothetical protein
VRKSKHLSKRLMKKVHFTIKWKADNPAEALN